MSSDPSPRKSEEFRVPGIRFLGEQDGPSERLLKDKLGDFFHRDKSVTSGYLVRVEFGDGKSIGVVLGLRTQFGPDKGMVEKVGAIFASIFNTREHLDIMFLTEGQEAQLIKTCKPFFGGKINTAADIYPLVERLKVESEKNGLNYLVAELNGALSLGSSGLEILGAIRNIFIENRATIERLLGPTGKEQAHQVIAFVDHAFGR